MKLIPITIKINTYQFNGRSEIEYFKGFIPNTCGYVAFYKYGNYFYVMHFETGLFYTVVSSKQSAAHVCETLEKNLDHTKLLKLDRSGEANTFTEKETNQILFYLRRIRQAKTYAEVKQIYFKD